MQSGSFAGARRRGHMFRCLVMCISRVTIYYVHAQARYILLSQDSLADHVYGVKWSVCDPIVPDSNSASGSQAPFNTSDEKISARDVSLCRN
jgi:hypothetical protein